MQDHKQHRHDRIIKTKPLNQHNNLNIHRIPANTTCMITNRLDLDHERSSQDLYMKAQRRRYNHLATTCTRSLRWNYSRFIPEKKASGMISPPAGCREELQIPPYLGSIVAAATDGFVEFLSVPR